MLPTILGMILFVAYPLFESLRLSMFAAQVGVPEKFVGLGNFDRAFKDPVLVKAIINTFKMAIYTIVLVIPGSFILATLINHSLIAKNFFKVVYYIPNVTSIIIISLLFKYIFYSTEQGAINYFLSYIGIEPIGWFTDSKWAQFSVAIMSSWISIGSNMLICLAGLQSISRQHYEAAEIDGANALQKWLHITLPASRPILAYILIMTTMNAMKRFGDVWMIGGQAGTPGGSLRTIVLYLYNMTFEYNSPGYGSAIAVILFIIILILTYINMKLVKFESDY